MKTLCYDIEFRNIWNNDFINLLDQIIELTSTRDADCDYTNNADVRKASKKIVKKEHGNLVFDKARRWRDKAAFKNYMNNLINSLKLVDKVIDNFKHLSVKDLKIDNGISIIDLKRSKEKIENIFTNIVLISGYDKFNASYDSITRDIGVADRILRVDNNNLYVENN